MNENQINTNVNGNTSKKSFLGGCLGGAIGIVIGVVILLAICLFTCARACSDAVDETNSEQVENIATSQNWQYDSVADPMNDKYTYTAKIKSTNYHEFEFPYNGKTYCSVTIRKSSTKGEDVIIKIDKGQILNNDFGVSPENSILVRFDDKPAKKYNIAGSSDGDSEFAFVKNSKDFIQNAKTAITMKIEMTVFNEGRRIYEFNSTEALNWNH